MPLPRGREPERPGIRSRMPCRATLDGSSGGATNQASAFPSIAAIASGSTGRLKQ